MDLLNEAIASLRAGAPADHQKLATLERLASHFQASTSDPQGKEAASDLLEDQLRAQRIALSLLSRNVVLPPALLAQVGTNHRGQVTRRRRQATELCTIYAVTYRHILSYHS